MAKISMSKAAKMFAVSRPTLSEHLKNGKISGEKNGETWNLDLAELQRVYPYRNVSTEAPAKGLSANLTTPAPPKDWELQSKIKVLEAELKAANEARELLQKNLDDFRNRLPAPGAVPARRWWPWSGA